MKTDTLIDILSEDLKPARRGIVLLWLALGLGVGLLISSLSMMMMLKPNPHLHQVMAGSAFWVKIAYTATLAVLGLVIVQRQARAAADSRLPILALGGPVAALIMLAAWQLSAPTADAPSLVMGHTWMICPWLIVALALPVFAGLFLALRQLAPTRLTLAGAAAGLVAGASAATIYGFHCREMAAPFILVWYTLGIMLAAGLGALLGRWALRW